MNRKTISITALDTLFFRDGKPFTMGSETWADTAFPPSPSVLYGALRSAYMFQKDIKATEMIAQTTDFKITNIYLLANNDVAFPMPYDLVKFKNENAVYLEKQTAMYSNINAEKIPFALGTTVQKKAEDMGGKGILTGNRLHRYLVKNLTAIPIDTLNNYMTLEPKIGMMRDNDTRGTSDDAEGMLYRAGMQRLEGKQIGSKLKIAIEYEGLNDFEAKGILRVGGEGKTANYETVKDYQKPILSESQLQQTNELKLYLSTPAIFNNGWLPDWLVAGSLNGIEVSLVTCALGKPQHIGGWDVAENEPKRMYKAVPAGSVYYIQTDNTIGLYAELQKLSSLSDIIPNAKWYENFATQGFGQFFIGLT